MRNTWRYRGGAALLVAVITAGAAHAGNGDVNGDDHVTVADAVLALRFAGGLQKAAFAQRAAADVEPAALNGTVTLADAARIARIAARLDPPAPAHALPAAVPLTVSGNTTLNIALPGGYAVGGTVLDAAKQPVFGFIAFQNTATLAVSMPVALADAGAYAALLPAGTYQAVVLTETLAQTGVGENATTDTAIAAGSPFTVSADAAKVNLARPGLPAPPTVTFTFQTPAGSGFIPGQIVLDEDGTAFDLNRVVRETATSPLPTAVPKGEYDVEADGTVPLSTGASEEFDIFYDQSLVVTANAAKTLAVPAVREVSGTITAPASVVLDTVELEGQALVNNAPAGDDFYATADIQDGGYLLAVPPGAYTLTVNAHDANSDIDISYAVAYTVPKTGTATKNAALPALPALRTVSGVVVGPDGGGSANAQVEAVFSGTTPAAGGYAIGNATATLADGTYTLQLPNGPYTVTATP